MKGLNKFAAVALCTAVGLTACSSDQTATGPSFDPLYTGDDSSLPQEITLCKIGPAGTTATFTIAANPTDAGTVLVGSPLTLNATTLGDLSKCVVIWRSNTSGVTGTVTVTEVDMTAGTKIESIQVIGGSVNTIGSNFAVVNTSFTGFTTTIAFKNIVDDTPPPPPPPPGGKGCTPGYWKVKPHLDSWPATGYTTGQSFESAFGVNAFPGKTLHQVLSQGGGHLIALGRHAVAALLNAAHPNVAYDMTPAQVVSAFQAAFASGAYEATKNVFEAFNEQGCPIN
jgi:hypothetical protein